ncbi:hypothetical protein AA11825_2800 [Acetobacter pomorum DSM 11825]|nr:hypothetical protein AA11825_2800 [Acetobacter pomorum DSM 11825]
MIFGQRRIAVQIDLWWQKIKEALPV